MKVTLSGVPGSGKSTVAKWISKEYNLEYYDMGGLRRKMAVDIGMTIDELNRLGEKESWTDEKADEYQKKLGGEVDNFVISGRLSWHFIPNSIKIFITVDQNEGAERVFREQRESERKYENVDDVKKEIECRITSDKKRYMGLYGVDPYDESHYDIVINTTNLNEVQTQKAVAEALKSLAGKSI